MYLAHHSGTKTIDMNYRSVAIHHVKVTRRHGSITPSPHLLYILFEGHISRRKSGKERTYIFSGWWRKKKCGTVSVSKPAFLLYCMVLEQLPGDFKEQ